MKISARGRYALRFMIYIALHSKGNCVSLKDVSENEDISIKYLEQITAMLNKASLLVSVRGPAGGYKLSRTAESYTAGEILRVTEMELAPCVDDEDENPAAAKHSSTKQLWKGLEKVIDDYLESVTLQDLVNQNTSCENFMYII